MIRLNLSYFYGLSGRFSALETLPTDVPLTEVWLALYTAQLAIQGLFNPQNVVSPSLRVSWGAASTLYDLLNNLTTKPDAASEAFSKFDHAQLVEAVSLFRTNLTSELAIADAYIVTPKGGLDREALVNRGEVLFPEGTAKKVPLALSDLKEAGRCIAFELPTAAAFHTLRAVEAVLRAYWEVVTARATKPKLRSLGVYIAALEKRNCGNAKVIAALRQLNELHRNPVIHPEVTLTVEQAISLLGLARSVTEAMLSEMPDPDEEALQLEG